MVTLDEIRAATEAKYIGYDVNIGGDEIVTMRNVLRLPKKVRDRLMNIKAEFEAEGADQAVVLASLIADIVGNKTAAKKLLDAIGEDLALMTELFAQYNKATQVGEA